MSNAAPVNVLDFLPMLSEAIDEVRAAGLAASAEQLKACAQAAYTTSSEMLGEIGVKIVATLRLQNPSLPAATRTKLLACLREVQKIWPDLRE